MRPIESHKRDEAAFQSNLTGEKKMLRVCLGGTYGIKGRLNVPRPNLLSLAGHMPELAFAIG